MSKTPKEIWCSSGLYYDYVTDWSEGSWCRDNDGGVKYVRADRIKELEAKLAKALGALVVINALAPESMVNGYSQSDLTELVSRMGKITRTTLAELKGQDDE